MPTNDPRSRLIALVERWKAAGEAEYERLKDTPLASGGNAMNAVYQLCAEDVEELLAALPPGREPGTFREAFSQLAAFIHHKSWCPQLIAPAKCICGLGEAQEGLINLFFQPAGREETPHDRKGEVNEHP